MTQVGSKTSFGYSARKMFGKDHHMVSSRRDEVEREKDFRASPTEKKQFSEEVTRLLKYACILQTAKGKQFENVLGRLHWMLKTIGEDADVEDEESVDELYETLRDLLLDNTRSKSSRWKIMELLELRANNWENSEAISEYYEDPANFMMGEMADKSPPPPPVSSVVYQPTPHMMYIPTQSASLPLSPATPLSARSSGSSPGYFTFNSPQAFSPDKSRRRQRSGGSTSHTTSSDGGSSRSRNVSGGSTGVSGYPRRGSGASSRQSVVEEDIFHDAEESFTTSSKNSSDSTDDSDDSSDGDVRSPTVEAVTPAKYRLMQINSGKPIKYTRNFLLGCWASPHTKVMPSTLQHTIANSDIAYIIKGPPFENPVPLIAMHVEPTTKLQAPLVKRSHSVPAQSTSNNYQPTTGPSPPPMRSLSVSTSTSPRDIGYYDLPPSIHSVQKAAVPVLLSDAWQRMFKDAIRQIDGKQ